MGTAPLRPLIWALPLLLFSHDAWAWGLYTHVHFTQLLICTVPLLDSRFRKAAQRFPELALAGACLPDLALMGVPARTTAFKNNHEWETARRLLADADSPEHRALALGYASHLMVDIVAHHHFVPAHETRWGRVSMLTHALSEWAMDAHIAPHLRTRPIQLLAEPRLAEFVAAHFDCSRQIAGRALGLLITGETALRRSRFPQGFYRTVRNWDEGMCRRFDRYLVHTQRQLPQINRILEGETPTWHAEPCNPSTTSKPGRPLPRDFFHPWPKEKISHQKESLARPKPMTAPASTSLG